MPPPASASKQRTDGYGGSAEASARFVIEVARAVVAGVGPDRVDIRISPAHKIQDVWETIEAETRATYEALVPSLAPLALAYLSVLHADPASDLIQDLRRTFIVSSGFSRITRPNEAATDVDENIADLVAVARPAIANPGLVTHSQKGADENEVDQASVYGGGETGYTDCPLLQD